MKKILYVITKSNFGGAQRYVFELATGLPKGQFEVVVVFGGNGQLAEKLKMAGIRTISIPQLLRDINPLADLWSLVALIKIFNQEKPDVIHLNSTKMGILGSIAGKLAGMPKIIFTAHGWFFNEDINSLFKLFAKILHWIGMILCDQIITINSRETDQVKNWLGVKKKFVKIYNGIGPINFLPNPEARRKIIEIDPELSQHENELWLGTVAELTANKGQDLLIEALHQVAITRTGFIAILIGEGSDQKKLEQLIEKYDLNHVVRLLGRVDNARDYLKAFDLFILPSRKEGLPYAILEAGAASLPVISNKVGGIPEIIDDQKSGLLVDSKKKDELTNAIINLLDNKKQREELGANLQEKILATFTVEKMITETISLY